MSAALIKDWRLLPPGREKYQLYLASREWALLKEAVRVRSYGLCERCGLASAENVHHQTYERVYNERLEDLLHVCRPCHEYLSGKRSDDPKLSAPPRLHGRLVETVYLAGKITGDNWRDEIIPGWSYESDEEGYSRHGCDNFQPWDVRADMVPLFDGRRLAYCGPYWCDLYGGHGMGSAAHTYGGCDQDSGPRPIKQFSEAETKIRNTVSRHVLASIERADLVFAWIDSLDCFGTLTEIGVAAGLDKLVVSAVPDGFDSSEIWLSQFFGCFTIEAPSPLVAWHYLWEVLAPTTNNKA